MPSENILILKMLDQGKISVDDSIKLLNIINSFDLKEHKHTSVENNLNKFSNVLDNLTKEIKVKVQKDAPKIKENTHSILSKTGEIFSDFGKNIKDIFSNDETEEVSDSPKIFNTAIIDVSEINEENQQNDKN